MTTHEPIVAEDDDGTLATQVHLDPYRSPEDLATATMELAIRAGGSVHEIGHSVQGRPIRAVEMRAPESKAPTVLVCANIHGIEFIAAEVALGILEQAAEAVSEVGKLRQKANIWVIPSLNPDAYAATWDAQGQGTLASFRKNANGVDLNRNYPKPAANRPIWMNFGGWRTGSEDPQNAFYRGSAPLSEPETRAIADLHGRIPIHASANLHSTMGTVIPPCVRSRADYKQYADLVNALRRGQPHRRYRRMANRWFDRFTGEQEDFQHHMHGTWAVCIEHYPLWVNPWRFRPWYPIFWRFNPRNPAPWIKNDIPGIAAFFEAALALDPAPRLTTPLKIEGPSALPAEH